MAEILTEIRKIPPVTRFLVASSLGITIPVVMHLISPWRVVFISQAVIKKFEVRPILVLICEDKH
jgi:Derlin-2/3